MADFASFGTPLDNDTPDFSQYGTAVDFSSAGSPVDPETDIGRLETAGSQFVRGAADVVASVPKSMSLIESARAEAVVGAFDKIDSGAFSGPDDPRLMASRAFANPDYQDDLKAYFSASDEDKQKLRQKYGAIYSNPQEQPLYKKGEAISEGAAERFPVNPEYADEFWAGTVPQGLGSATGFLGTGVLGRAAGLSAAATAAGAGAAVGGAGQFEEALNDGATLEEAFEAGKLSAFVGTSEAVPITGLLNRLDKVTGGGVKKVFADALKQGTEEAIQEAFQTISNNLIASDLVGYDPERGTFTGAGEASGAGFTVGALMQTVAAMVMPGRYRKSPNESAPEGTQEQPAPETPRAPLTEEDHASPLPDALISEGKGLMDELLSDQDAGIPEGAVSADTILGAEQAQPVPVQPEAMQAEEQAPAQRVRQAEMETGLLSDTEVFGEAESAQEAMTVRFPAVEGDGTPQAPVQVQGGADVDIAAERVAEPTEAQKEAGNYRKGHVKVSGLDVTIENAKGSTRSGTDADGNAWSVEMPAHYGYVKRTEGADGDHVDVYIGDNPESDTVYVVDQINADEGTFDEHKALVGFPSADAALAAYDAAFNDGRGPDRRGAVTPMTVEAFRDWLKGGDTKKPVAWKRQTDPAILPESTPSTFEESQQPASVGPQISQPAQTTQEQSTNPDTEELLDIPEFLQRKPDDVVARPEPVPDVPDVKDAPAKESKKVGGNIEAIRAAKFNDTKDAIYVAADERGIEVSEERLEALARRHTDEKVPIKKLVDEAALDTSYALRPNDAKTGIRALVKKAAERAKTRFKEKAAWLVIDRVSGERAKEISETVGVDVSGFSHIIDEDAIRKILKDHGNPKSEKLRGNVAISEVDIELIPEIIADGKIVSTSMTRSQTPAVIYEKRIGDTYYYVEEVRAGRKALAAKTMWKRPERFAMSGRTDETAPKHTPEDFSDSTERIAQSAPDDKEARLDAMADDLQSALIQHGIDDKISLRVVDSLATVLPDGTQRFADASYQPGRKLITVALDAKDGKWALDHETIHALRDLGLFKDAEWRVLENAARNDRKRMDEIRKRYEPAGLTESQLEEEAIADMFADWAKGDKKTKGFIRTAFERIRAFLESLGNALKGNGYRTAADVFGDVGAGEVGAREQGPSEAEDVAVEERFALRPVDAAAAATGVSADVIRKAGGAMWGKAERVRGTAREEAALSRILADPGDVPIGERLRNSISDFKAQAGRRLRQGLFDQFDAIAHYEKAGNAGALLDAATSAYKAARLTQNLQSVMHVMLKRGMIGYKGGQFSRVDGFDGGFEGIFEDLAARGLMRLWSGWAIANRSKRLAGEGRENLLSAGEIDTLLGLEQKYPEFRRVLKKWERYNRAVLDMAEAAGVVDPESRKIWENEDYVPFYRVIEDDGNIGPTGKKGIANQRSGIRRLEGGEAQINDLIENMVMNATHLADASFKNVAAHRAIREAGKLNAVEKVGMDWTVSHIDPNRAAELLEDIGVQVRGMTAAQREERLKLFTMRPPKDPDVVSVLVKGKPQYYRVDDPLLLSALTHMDRKRLDWFTENLLGPTKNLLTKSITAFPDFMIANAIRDSMSAWVVSGGKTNPISAAKGFVSSLRDSASRQAIAAGGGGTAGYYDVTPQDVRQQLGGGLGGDTKGLLRHLWEAWMTVGQAAENANRIAIFEKLKSEGVSDAEAAFQAMDLMDFSMRGDWRAVRWLATTVPFLNARLQGLYKLGRAAAANPAGFALRGSAIAAATMTLMAANWDDERYEALPDWEKDTYYHVWAGDTHIRIPKPFEVGAIFSTLPERLARFFAGKEDGERFGEALLRMFGDTFAFNPLPQAVRPIGEQWANQNFFTGAPIEGMYMQDILPGQRVRGGTSALAREIGEAFPETVSPVRLDAMIQGYLGTLGTLIMDTSNTIEEIFSDTPHPARRIDDVPVIRRFVRADPPKYTRFINDFYELRDEVTQIVRSAKKLAEDGRRAEAYKLLAENPQAAGLYKMTNRASRKMSSWSEMQRRIRKDKNMSPDEKRRRIDELYAARNALAKRAVEKAGAPR